MLGISTEIKCLQLRSEVHFYYVSAYEFLYVFLSLHAFFSVKLKHTPVCWKRFFRLCIRQLQTTESKIEISVRQDWGNRPSSERNKFVFLLSLSLSFFLYDAWRIHVNYSVAIKYKSLYTRGSFLYCGKVSQESFFNKKRGKFWLILFLFCASCIENEGMSDRIFLEYTETEVSLWRPRGEYNYENSTLEHIN
jgi:hypothetical protein